MFPHVRLLELFDMADIVFVNDRFLGIPQRDSLLGRGAIRVGELAFRGTTRAVPVGAECGKRFCLIARCSAILPDKRVRTPRSSGRFGLWLCRKARRVNIDWLGGLTCLMHDAA